jgi:hypothetical protein
MTGIICKMSNEDQAFVVVKIRDRYGLYTLLLW